MTLLHRVASILHWLVHRNRAERELNDELQAFVDVAAADWARDGTPPADARRLAVLHRGGVEQVKKRVRSGRHGAWLDEIGGDLRYAIRMCARTPGVAVVAVLTLALGIGVSKRSLLLRPRSAADLGSAACVLWTFPSTSWSGAETS